MAITEAGFDTVVSVRAFLAVQDIRELDGCESDEAVDAIAAAVEAELNETFPEATVFVTQKPYEVRDRVELSFADDDEDEEEDARDRAYDLRNKAEQAALQAMDEASRRAIERAEWLD